MGLDRPVSLRPEITYKVPFDKRAQLIYLRAGNSLGEMIYLVLSRGKTAPCAISRSARRAPSTFSWRSWRTSIPESVLDLSVGAPEGQSASVVIDIGPAGDLR